MQYEISARHTDLTAAIETYAQRKLEKLPRYFDRTQRIELIFEPIKVGFSVECIVEVEHHDPFVGRQEHADLYAAIDLVVDTMARQLKDHKTKVRDSQRHAPSPGTLPE
jgi:putative sigma-54 modulation protein